MKREKKIGRAKIIKRVSVFGEDLTKWRPSWNATDDREFIESKHECFCTTTINTAKRSMK